MKFYFCETCGKRLTEHDIDGGVAKNKKLKGVFCKECAVGVTTMESLPLTDREAKEVLEDKSSRPQPSSTSRRHGRRNSAVGLPPATGRRASRAEASGGPSNSKPAPISYLKVIVSGVVVAMVTVVALVALSGQRHSPREGVKGPREGQDETKELDSRKTEAPPKEPKTRSAVIGKAPVELPKDPAPQNPAPSPVAVRTDENTLKQVSPPKEPTGDTKKNAGDSKPKSKSPEPSNAPAKPTDIEVAEAKLGTYMDAFDQALSKGDLTGAGKIAERAKSDPSLKTMAKEVAALDRVGKALAVAEAARKRALTALADGKKRAFVTRKGTVTGVVRKVVGDTLFVRVEGRINKQVIEYEKRVALADLKPACRASLLGGPKPVNPDEWIAEAVWNLAARDIERAKQALTEAGAHPLARLLKKRLRNRRTEMREDAARVAWDVIQKQTKGKLTRDSARRTLESLQRFEVEFGSTQFAKVQVKAHAELRARLQFLAAGTEDRLRLRMGARLVSFDPRTKRVELRYTFEDPRELEDWKYTATHPPEKLVENGLISTAEMKETMVIFRIPLSGDARLKWQGQGRVQVGAEWKGTKDRSTRFTYSPYRGLRIARFSPGGTTRNESNSFPGRPDYTQSHRVGMSIQERGVRISSEGKVLLDYWVPEKISLPKKGIRWYAHFNVYRAALMDEISIEGTLDPEWLAELLKGRK